MAKIGKTTLFSGLGGALSIPHDKQTLKKSREVFGFLGADYRPTNFNPDVEQAIAKPEDFLPFFFRHISATIVGAGTWKATEFPEAVLKKARPLLEEKPAYVNHEAEVSNNIGLTGKAEFQEAFIDSKGERIPAGLIAPIWIDGKLHIDLCRKLSAYPKPHLQSVSIGVIYEWEPSHTFTDSSGQEDEWLFEGRIGQQVDGKMVRRIATKILNIEETSLVFMGADPFAKVLNDKKEPINVEKWAVVGQSQFSKDPMVDYYKRDPQHHFFVFDEGSYNTEKAIYLSNRIIIDSLKLGNSNKSTGMKVKLQLIGKPTDEKNKTLVETLKDTHELEFIENYDELKLKADRTTTAEAEASTVKESLTKIQNQFTAANDKLKELEAVVPFEKLADVKTEFGDLSKIIPFAKQGFADLDAKRKECVRLYKLKAGDKASEEMVKNIEKAEGKLLDDMLAENGGAAFGKFTGKCKKCASTEIDFRQSKETETDPVPVKFNVADEMLHDFRQ